MLRKILIFIAWILAVGLVVFITAFVAVEHHQKLCRGMEIKIFYTGSQVLLKQEDVFRLLFKNGKGPEGVPLYKINTSTLESRLKTNYYILQAEVYHTTDGVVHVDIIQRDPIARVISEGGKDRLMDKEGMMMPLDERYPVRVLVVNGSIPDSVIDKKEQTHKPFSTSLISSDSTKNDPLNIKIFRLASFIEESDFLKAQISQIYVTPSMEFELIPVVGRHVVVFGDTTRMREKFEKLIIFYKKGLVKAGFDTYKTINIKYKDQVICSKH
ncbi:MAG: hypothetical protein FJY10_03355 [Bacteroidetes bacterium]|nr:hypothetical protein [Bacteroidota bacterium]